MRPNPNLDEKMLEAGFVSVQEAEKRTAIPSSTIYDALKDGRLTGTRVGSRHYVNVESLLDFGGDAIRSLWQAGAAKG
jgi:excisionase family DNA binding protein